MPENRIQAIDHVHLEAPFGIEEELRWFYVEVAALDEVVGLDPSSTDLRFRSERIEVRINRVERPRVEAAVNRLTVAVRSLAEAERLLSERRVAFQRETGFGYTSRVLLTQDPAGHRVTLKRDWSSVPL